MNKKYILEEMLYAVSDEIGTDISFVSTNENGYQYLTGMDFALILAAGISSTFFVPLISAYAKKIGEELAKTSIVFLDKITDRSQKQLKERNTDSKIIVELISIVPEEIFVDIPFHISDYEQKAIKSKQIAAIINFLEKNNFPQDKARVLAEQICNIMHDAISDALEESETTND